MFDFFKKNFMFFVVFIFVVIVFIIFFNFISVTPSEVDKEFFNIGV